MSASDTTAAPAGQTASTPQQQTSTLNQQPAAPATSSPPVQSVAQANVGGDSLTCQWQSCGERLATAEQLYVCERHVGRKSTNNLNLTCQWGNCRTTTVKRDHITSHIRVHVPLKPHKCDFCGKAFKRPQDLKKHVKTHADDSVLLRSPEPGRASQNPAAGYARSQVDNKLVQDLQTLAATASGFYPQNGSLHGGYYQDGTTQGPYQSAPSAPHGSAYGPVYYAVNGQTMSSDYEIRKRAAFDALNEFFGDAKRRIIDPATYYDVGNRLAGLQGMQLPMIGAGGGGYSGGDSYGGGMAPAASHMPQQHYQLPALPNLRTKNDLVNIDQFLEQLQSTVYENSNHAAAAGVQQAGTHYVPTGLNYGRSSGSPPSIGQQQASHATSMASSHANVLAPLTTPQTETPALTPASSVVSYTSASGQSPGSVHSHHSPSRTSSVGMSAPMYPTLPSVSAMDMGASSAYSTAGAAAPSSSLASGYESDGRRRYSGGLLQKQAPERRNRNDERMEEDAPTPKPIRSSEATPEAEDGRHLDRDIKKMNIMSPSMIDPAMCSPAGRSDSGDAATPHSDEADNQQRQWIENVRMIELLRELVKYKLEHGEFEEGNGGDARQGADKDADIKMDESEKSESERIAESLYPVLRAVREGD